MAFDPSYSIHEHLTHWGLRSFSSEQSYYSWQHQVLGPEQLRHLADLAQHRLGPEGGDNDLAFYDLAATPSILPVLYSQRFGYYAAVGPAIAQHLRSLPPGASVLDIGCGVGILTTWYALVFPHLQFIGLDRSSASIRAGAKQTSTLNLENLKFVQSDFSQPQTFGPFDGIISTQSLFQSEKDPGLPSQSWRNFQRVMDVSLQVRAEERSGLAIRFNSLIPNLQPEGILLLFEKTAHLGRRVLFQRALQRRGFSPLQPPIYLRYHSLGQMETEGPLYVMSRENPRVTEWDESPVIDPKDGLYYRGHDAAQFLASKLCVGDHKELWSARIDGRSHSAWMGAIGGGLSLGCLREGSKVLGIIVGRAADEGCIRDILLDLHSQRSSPSDFQKRCGTFWPTNEDPAPVSSHPIYENHSVLAQEVWEGLPDRRVLRTQTKEEGDGRGCSIELGECSGSIGYLYWANTFDQRQIVMMEMGRNFLLREYFDESVQ